MNAAHIAYNKTNRFSSTLLAYIQRNAKLEAHIRAWPDLKAFEDQMALKEGQTDRLLLTEVLRSQYLQRLKGFGSAPEDQIVLDQIDSLRQENTFTVTTGHQLNVFTGPLYFIFKIVSAIRLAQDLKKAYPQSNFVPVYWMASEDHDFAEINHTYFFGEKIVWDRDAAGATGRMKTDTMADAVRRYQQLLGGTDRGLELSKIVEDAYLGHENLADATRALVHKLFASYGLVILDADDTRLKASFAPIMEEDILQQKSFFAVQESNQALTEAGFSTQIHAREINFFYLTEQYRERLLPNEGGFEVNRQELNFTLGQLKEELAQHPERFSPNVVMRPLYQEFVLPNLAYIGGGAEIVYWLQLKKIFDQFQVPFPLLIPRNSGLIGPENLMAKCRKLDLHLEDLFKDLDEVKKQYVRTHSHHTLDLNAEWNQISALFDQIKGRAMEIDPTLGPSTEAVRARLQRQWNSLEKKLVKADQRNHGDALGQIERLIEKLFPNSTLQERTDNFAAFYLRYGERFIPSLLRHFDPLDLRFTVFY